MARKQRVNYSIDGDVLDAFEDAVPPGQRSERVQELLAEEYADE
jgi:hypothetical protein